MFARSLAWTKCLFGCLLLTSSATAASRYEQTERLQIRHVSPPDGPAQRFGRMEFTVDVRATYVNPFDSSEIALDAEFTSPSGRKLWVPGFFDQQFTRTLTNRSEKLIPDGQPAWRVRFSPEEVGVYGVVFHARDRSGAVQSVAPARFTVAKSAHAGFIRISKQDRRYFARDDGIPYFPIGANTCWSYGRGTFDFDDWFKGYASAGCNYGRLWLSPNWTTFALEQKGKPEEGLGLGYFNLANAWRIDYVLDLAARNGMALMLCIDSYNILRQKDGYPQWDNTPHNAANGGPLNQPSEFWTNSVMDKLYKDKLRYLVARYGYSPAVLSWEFWNEADITTGYRSEPSKNWHQRMAKVLRDLDPYDHLITTSFAGTQGDRAVDTLPGIDYVQTHHYNSPDLAITLAREQARKAAYGKPHIVGEIGADSGGPRTKDDPDGLQVHDPIWVSIATGGSGTAQPWWWDNLIHPRDLYHLFEAASRFSSNINWPAEGFRSIQPAVAWATKPIKTPRADLAIAGGPASWTASEFNRPRTVRVTSAGATGDMPVSRVQHGLGGHRDKHNPITFQTEFREPVRFEVEIGDVSGHGGAALKISLDGLAIVSTNFPDPDTRSTSTLKQFVGTHGIDVPAGKHVITVENTGADWFMADYRFRSAIEKKDPPILSWGVAGKETVIAWARLEERTWDRVCNRKKAVDPVGPTILTLPEVGAGKWQVQIWDTWKGVITEQREIMVSGSARIPLPIITKDVAVKMIRASR